MKRLPIVATSASQDQTGPRLFRSLAERNGQLPLEDARAREFIEDRPFEPPSGVNRRTFLSLMGASMSLGGLAACHRPEEKIIPFAHQPEDIIPGRPEYFATSMPFYGTAIGIVVESNDGRPTKIEGNRLHPESLGGTSSFVQGHILNLYDPDRSDGPEHMMKDIPLEDVWNFLGDLGQKMLATKGKGLGIIITDHRSHTTQEALNALMRQMPEAHVVKHEAFGREQARVGTEIAMGEQLETVYRVKNADVIVAFDSDFLGTEGSPIRCAKEFSARRRVENGNMNRLYVAEPCPTVTSSQADHRLRVQSRRVCTLLRGLAGALAKAGVNIQEQFGTAVPFSDREQKWLDAVAKDLASAKTKGLVIVGRRQDPAVHALAVLINDALGSLGVAYKTSFGIPENFRLGKLVDQMNDGTITALVMLGGNPVFTAPSDLKLAAAMAKVPVSFHLSFHQDDTTKLATWHLPRAHELECWSDTRAEDGTASIVQPLIAPMYDGKTDAEILNRLSGGTLGAYELVRQAYVPLLIGEVPPGATPPADTSADVEKAWRRALFDGKVLHSEFPDKVNPLDKGNVLKALDAYKAPDGPFEVVFAPDPHVYDGRYRNNGWLQETPDPVHKVTWTNVAAISAATAAKLGVEDGTDRDLPGNLLTVEVGGAKVTLPLMVAYGHADDSVTVYVGQGREFTGEVPNSYGLEAGKREEIGLVGVDVRPIRQISNWDIGVANVTKADGTVTVPATQMHHTMDGRPVVREQTVDAYKRDSTYAKDLVIPQEEKAGLQNSWGDPYNYARGEYNESGHKWGMTIDLSLCTGCSACVTACVAENNIVVVGPAGVAHHREMHWIRIDRYFAESVEEGERRQSDPSAPRYPDVNEDEARAVSMPMACQHCENAPCEQVCPVAATTHSPEGINEMTYNRCIGTKYCGNNCPFKVRRFNFFNYTKDIAPQLKLVLNPDVTVRSRGVMEKCTFCVQRVQEAKIKAKQLRRADGSEWTDPGERIARENEFMRAELVSACQQACPSDAIIFGDLNDPRSEVARSDRAPRGYKMLEELQVRPRITYLGRIRNPNPELEPPKPAAEKAPAEKVEEK